MSNYQKGKARAIEKAQFWQNFFAEVSMSWGEVAFGRTILQNLRNAMVWSKSSEKMQLSRVL